MLRLGIGQPEGKVLQYPYSVQQARVKPGKQPQAERLFSLPDENESASVFYF